MLKIVLFLLTLCFVVPLDAQEVYYPLNAGDGWQLRQITWTTPPIYSFINFMIVSDTTMPNGHTYGFISELNPLQREILSILEVPLYWYDYGFLFDTS